MSRVTNADLYGVLLEIKEDIGGLKSSAALQVTALDNHGKRIGLLEQAGAKQKGAARVWGLVATAAATASTALIEYWRR